VSAGTSPAEDARGLDRSRLAATACIRHRCGLVPRGRIGLREQEHLRKEDAEETRRRCGDLTASRERHEWFAIDSDPLHHARATLGNRDLCSTKYLEVALPAGACGDLIISGRPNCIKIEENKENSEQAA
jgi:hypothetical protein